MNPEMLSLLLVKVVMFLTVGGVFFRKGKHTLFWYLTLAPFVVSLVTLPLFAAGALPAAWSLPSPYQTAATVAAAVLCSAAIALYAATLSTHRERIPMWHQPVDLPDGFVSWGPYAYVRHPFYTSYFLFYIACVLAAPSWVVVANSAYALLILNYTAAVEERQLAASTMGAAYRRYMQRAGRFFPRVVGAQPSAVAGEVAASPSVVSTERSEHAQGLPS